MSSYCLLMCILACLYPVNTRRWPNDGLMLAQHRRRWASIIQHWANDSCLLGVFDNSVLVLLKIAYISYIIVEQLHHNVKRKLYFLEKEIREVLRRQLSKVSLERQASDSDKSSVNTSKSGIRKR